MICRASYLLFAFSLLAVVTGPSLVSAREPSPPPRGCDAAVYHKLDFWLGAWDVTDDKGHYDGTNVITRALGGCAVEEHWLDSSGHLGQSLFYVDGGSWRQVWVTVEGIHKEKSEQPGAPAGGIRFVGKIDRTTLTPEANGTVRQVIEGKQGAWTGIYKRIPKACDGAETHQMDFWLGDWSVKVQERIVSKEAPTKEAWTPLAPGSNHVVSVLNGCAVAENFAAAGGPKGASWSGKSYSTWVATEKRWRQTWVDDSGSYLAFSGGMQNGEMILTGEPGANGSTMRMVFYDIAKDHFQWRWESTRDGKSWLPMMKIEYRRVSPAP